MTIDISRKYKTVAGEDVRILCVDRDDKYPVLGLVANQVRCWRADGTSASGVSYRDLVEVVPTVWRTIGSWRNEADTCVPRGGGDGLFVGDLKLNTLDELRIRLSGYKFAGEFQDNKLLRVVAL